MSTLNGHALNGHARNGHATNGVLATEERLPPQNLEAERGVLGSVLLEGSALDEVATILTADDFYRDSHQVIYRAMLALYAEGQRVDSLTVADRLETTGEMARIGDPMLADLVMATPHAANARYYAEIVRQKAIARGLAESANDILRDVYSGLYTANELANGAQSKVMAVTEGRGVKRVATLSESLDEVVDLIRRRQGGNVTGLGSGYADLDSLTSGFQPGSLNVLAARPSMGKSAIAANMAEYIALGLARSVLFVSLEMTKAQLIERMICGRSGINGHQLATGIPRLSRAEWERIEFARNQLNTPLLTIDESPAQTSLEIMATARSRHRQQPLGLIVVDYIQIVSAEDDSRSRQEQVAKISARLKALARELNVAVLALSQLNRLVEQREDRRPRMADLRESGAIEQDADVVMLLHRPEYYDPNDKPGMAEVIVAKNRHGAIGTIPLVFRKDVIRFESLAVQEPIDPGDF